MSHRQLSEAAHVFRCRVLDGLDRVTPGAFEYWTSDDFAHVCPVCGGPLRGHFHGFDAAVDLECVDHGCAESRIVAALRKVTT